jgi:Protein of unknown function (DUF4239)
MRTLLNTFPTWLLAIVTVCGAVGVSLGGLALARRRFPELEHHGSNDLVGVVVGVLAAVLGILLGFVTVSVYQDFTDAEATVQRESTEVIQLYSDSFAFEPSAARSVAREIKSYLAAVRFSEWESMREGDAQPRAGDKHVADLYRVLQAYEPDTRTRVAFYADAVARLNDIVDARRARLTAASEEMPAAFRTVLWLGVALLIASMYLLATSNRRLQAIMVVSVAVLTSFNLLIVVALDHPFSGDISVSNQPFDEGRLAGLHVTRANLRGP